MISGAVLTETARSILKNFGVTTSRLSVRLHPSHTLLASRRVNSLELILFASNCDTSESVRNETVDEVGERRKAKGERVDQL